MNETHQEYITTTEQVEHVAHGHHYDHFYQDPAFWVGMSFILVVAALAKPIGKIVSSMMKNKIKSISDYIDEVKQLEIDSKKLLKIYENKLSTIETEVGKIIEKSNTEIEFTKKASLKSLEKELNRRKEDVEQLILTSTQQAEKEISIHLSDTIVSLVQKTIQENLKAKHQDDLIEKSIDHLKSLKK